MESFLVRDKKRLAEESTNGDSGIRLRSTNFIKSATAWHSSGVNSVFVWSFLSLSPFEKY